MSMFDDDQYDDDNDGDERTVTVSRDQIRALEKRPKREEFIKVQRELTLLKLGVNTDSAAGKLMLSNSELPWDKPDDIKALAIEVGAIKVETTEPEPPKKDTTAEEGELGATDERTTLASGAKGDEGKSLADPRTSAMEEANTAMKRGAKEEEALGHFINRLAEAAQGGDTRVITR